MKANLSPKDVALDTIAVTLILIPEPTTTAIGVAMLARPRGKGVKNHSELVQHSYPEYQYRVESIRGREITWEVRTYLPGQLPYEELNKPVVNIKPREQTIYSRMQSAAKPASKLPSGAKVHHEIFRSSPLPLAGPNVYIPGETIHHTLRQLHQQEPMASHLPSTYTHHTIKNSPGHIKAQAGGVPVTPQSDVIYHTIQDSPGAQRGNPAHIIKPVRIVQHHELDKKPSVNINGRLIKLPPSPPNRPHITGRNSKSG